MSLQDCVGSYSKSVPCFIDEANVNSHCFIARVIRYVFYVGFYVRCDGQTPDEAPIAWNLCHFWHIFHAIGRKERKKETEKEKKKRKKKEERKGEKERETLFQLSSISRSRPRRRLTRVARALTKESIFYLHSSHLSMVRSSVACSASESFDSAPLS